VRLGPPLRNRFASLKASVAMPRLDRAHRRRLPFDESTNPRPREVPHDEFGAKHPTNHADRRHREIGNALRYILAAANDEELSRRARSVGTFALQHAPAEDSTAFADLRASHGRTGDLLRLMRELMGPRLATRERVELRPIVERVKRWATAGAARDISVETVYDDELAAIAQARLVEQILVNLLDNAAHAVRRLGSPRVRLHVYAHGETAIISVRDNGPGIAPEIQAQLFEPFATTRRGEGGMGLGLALCRDARQIGAEISVSTARGRGCCFRLRLRRAG